MIDSTQSVLIIGSKPYEKLQVDNLIDAFKNNIRCNMGIPCRNNGTVKDELALVGHIHDHFVIEKSPWKKVMEVYGKEYKHDHIDYFYGNFSIKDYNNVWRAKADELKINFFLKKIGCPYKFSKPPRTGFICILNKLMDEFNDIPPIIFKFSITEEIRKTEYIKDWVFQKEEDGTSCHNKEDEIAILRWLHKNDYIDATLCMLQDSEAPTLNYEEIEPSQKVIDLLRHVYPNDILKDNHGNKL